MGKCLSDDQLPQYAEEGYVHPIPALTADELSAGRTENEAFEV